MRGSTPDTRQVFGPRVGVVDDHPAVVAGVSLYVKCAQDLQLAGCSTTVSGLLSDPLDLDVVILGLNLADGSTPAQNIRRIHAADASVIAYPSGAESDLVHEAFRSGVDGVANKSQAVPAVLDVVRSVLRGEPVPRGEEPPPTRPPGVGLTHREAEVLRLYAAGAKADHVARVLKISRHTILEHVRQIRRKYHAAGRPADTKVDLYRRAVEDGLLTPP